MFPVLRAPLNRAMQEPLHICAFISACCVLLCPALLKAEALKQSHAEKLLQQIPSFYCRRWLIGFNSFSMWFTLEKMAVLHVSELCRTLARSESNIVGVTFPALRKDSKHLSPHPPLHRTGGHVLVKELMIQQIHLLIHPTLAGKTGRK